MPAAIHIVKFLNGQDADTAPGPHVAAGSTVTFTYVVTDTGNVPLANVVVTDDKLGAITSFTGDTNGNGLLDTTETWVYTRSATALTGQQANIGTVSAKDSTNLSTTVTDANLAHYFGDAPNAPGIQIVKFVNGQDANTAPGPHVTAGSTVTFTYVVTNTGSVPLGNVAVSDNKLGAITSFTGDSNANGLLDTNETWTYTTTATAMAGQQTNTGTATAADATHPGTTTTDINFANYFGDAPGIHIVEFVNGQDADSPTGPHVFAGSTVTFTYVVTDIGNVPLANVVVTDDKLGHITSFTGDSNGNGLLDTTETWTYTATATALAGQQTNTGTATGRDANNPPGTMVTATNPANYFGTLNPSPPPGTTADMILRASNTSPTAGQYEIYDIGNNAILAANFLGQVGTDFQFAGLGRFFGTDTTDMLLRSGTTGAFEVYDISNNNITNAAALGTVGLDFQGAGFGDFNRDGSTDMILRNRNTGQFELYDIVNNQITSAFNIGTVGLDFQVAGFGDFNGDGSSDMILRNRNTGQFELYDIVNNQITSAFNVGTVGLDFQVAGFGDFNGDGSSDMILRNRNTGQFELYDIVSNQITSAFNIGTVGLDFQVAGFGPFHAPGASDMILRNVNTGQFEVYDIVNNQITSANSLGAVGVDWQLGGFAGVSSTGSSASMGSSDTSTSQLVQAMAGFGGGGGAADELNTAPLSADTTQETLLTTPQHA
jgi:uncharacterized repeat protein (TIGR01451 family)